MGSAGVSNCFEVLINGILTLIGSILRNLKLTWNWLFENSSIFGTKAIEINVVISSNNWGYLNTIIVTFVAIFMDVIYIIFIKMRYCNAKVSKPFEK